ncbi:type II toxin-antitoxin system MqsA family antitoxin [Cystobacter fuscus]
MEGFTCPTCNRGEIVMSTGRGRHMRYRHIPDLELPEELALPTCSACGERWLDAESTRNVEAALEIAYREELTRKAEQAIEALRSHLPQRDLERLLGVSAGLLSKLKNGKETSASMVALLMLLAEQPHRVEELRRLWAVHPEPPHVVELGPVNVRLRSGLVRPSLFEEVAPTSTQVRVSVGSSASPEVVRLVA